MDGRKRPADRGRCGHLCYPVEAMPIDGGRVARCLGCGRSGPVRASATEALAALRERGTPEVWGRRHLRLVGAPDSRRPHGAPDPPRQPHPL